jgi:histidinol-phosphatase (PHP family)
VELNTAGLRKPCKEIYPHPDLLRAYQQAGVPITFASDAHAPAEVASEFGTAVEVLRAAGYAEYVTFDKRKRVMQLLPSVGSTANADASGSAGAPAAAR